MVNERKIRLLGPNEIRQLAEELDLNPTKKLGQNFVHDPNLSLIHISEPTRPAA